MRPHSRVRGLMIGAELDQDPFQTALLAGPADQVPEPCIGEEIKRPRVRPPPEEYAAD